MGRVLSGESGHPEACWGLIDITERKRAEEVIRSSEARLQSILENSTAVIYLKDQAGRYIVVNRRWEDLFHLRRDQIVGRTSREIFPEDVAARFKANDDKCAQAGIPLEFEETVPQDGKIHTYLSVKFPVTEGGAFVAVGGISTDISDLKQITQDLMAERELLKNMIEVQENEKQIICYEIHDGLIQYVAGALMLAETVRQGMTEFDDSAAMLQKAISGLRFALDEGRRVIQGVRPMCWTIPA